MKTLLHDRDVRREGREEGREEGRVEERRIIVLNMLREGMNNSDICKLIGCNIEYIEEIRKDMES